MLRKDHSNSRKRVPSAALRLAQEGQQGEDGERSVSQRNSLSFSPSKSRPRGQVATFEWLRGARREVRYQEFRELMVRKHADREQLLARPINAAAAYCTASARPPRRHLPWPCRRTGRRTRSAPARSCCRCGRCSTRRYVLLDGQKTPCRQAAGRRWLCSSPAASPATS